LRKFKEELEQSKGVSTNLSSITNKFNTLTDNINDIRAILPTREQFDILEQRLATTFRQLPDYIVMPVVERINRLQANIPSSREFQKVSAESELLQYETLTMLQDLTETMPTKAQIQQILTDLEEGRISQIDAFQRVQDAISGVSDAQLDALDDLTREIQQSRPGKPSPFNALARIYTGIPELPILAVESKLTDQGLPVKSPDLYIIYSTGNNEKLTLTKLKALIEGNEDFKRWYADNIGGGLPTLTTLRNYIIDQGVSEVSRKERSSSAVSDDTSKETFSTEKSGFGLKAKNGRIRTKKIGEGLKYEPEPTYRQFGKYVINIPQLKERDILNVKFPSLGRIPQFKPTPISDVMKEFILELLDTGKVSNRIYEQIPIDERQLFEKIAQGAGILNALKLKRTISNEDKEDNDRFTLLKGEYLAGNNSVALLKELRKLVVKFMSQGKISKQDGMNLLIELSV
jgi:hypothetical protein